MDNSILIIMVGIPASGKSTFCKKHLNPSTDIYVSRDEIRYSLLKEGNKYFSKENEVFNTFVKKINEGLSQGKRVWADATHISMGSRRKLLQKIPASTNVQVYWMDTPLEVAIARNERRLGTRAFVPRETMRNMAINLQPPQYFESKKIKNIYKVSSSKVRKGEWL